MITGMLNQTINASQWVAITLFGVVTPNRLDNELTGFFGFALLGADGQSILEGNFLIDGIVP